MKSIDKVIANFEAVVKKDELFENDDIYEALCYLKQARDWILREDVEEPAMIITDKPLEFGGYVSAWCDAKYFTPNDDEHLIFKLARDKDGVWHDGNYFPQADMVRKLITSSPVPVYWEVPFGSVEYWMHIPPTPKSGKM